MASSAADAMPIPSEVATSPTPVCDYSGEVASLRAAFETGVTKSLEWRKAQLRALVAYCLGHHEDVTAAVRADLGGPKIRGYAELQGAVSGARLAIEQLDRWAADRPVEGAPIGGAAFVRPEPKGVVLVIAPWNYPVAMCLDPLVAALAAGNCVLIKPSEISTHSARLIEQLVHECLDCECVKVVQGAVAETTALLAERWDHIMYTGNGAVGRIVMAAAARHLTPVTLELGGKSPTYVDSSAKLEHAVKRINFFKWLNVGQTCVAPDYILVHETVAEEFARAMEAQLRSWFGADGAEMESNPSLGRLISASHGERVAAMVRATQGRVLVGGLEAQQAAAGGAAKQQRDPRWLCPTLILNPSLDEPLMRSEIFGPVLPILAVRDVEEAIAITHRICAQPLALYVYAEEEAVIERYLGACTSGGEPGVSIMEAVHFY